MNSLVTVMIIHATKEENVWGNGWAAQAREQEKAPSGNRRENSAPQDDRELGTERGRRKQGSFHAELCRGLRAESSTALPKAVRPVWLQHGEWGSHEASEERTRNCKHPCIQRETGRLTNKGIIPFPHLRESSFWKPNQWSQFSTF